MCTVPNLDLTFEFSTNCSLVIARNIYSWSASLVVNCEFYTRHKLIKEESTQSKFDLDFTDRLSLSR